MTRSDTIGKIAAALAKAQATIEGASKDARNPHFNSRYADLAAIYDACRQPLAANEIAVLQSPSTDANLVRMTTLLLHSSGEWIESDPLQVQARDANPQAVGSCLTYLRRYQLSAMVGVAPEDDDAESAEGRSRGTAARAASDIITPASAAALVTEAASRNFTAPPAKTGDDHRLPYGVRLIQSVGPGRAGSKAEIHFADGQSVLTFDDGVRVLALDFAERQEPCIPEFKRSQSGNLRVEKLSRVPPDYDPSPGKAPAPRPPIAASEIPFARPELA